MSYQVMLDCGLQVLVTGHLCEVRDNHGRVKFAGNHEQVADWTAARGIRGWPPPAEPVFPPEQVRIERSIYGDDEVALLTPEQLQRIVEASSDTPNFNARLAATVGHRKRVGMLAPTEHRYLDGWTIEVGEPPKSAQCILRRVFQGRGFVVTASRT